MSPASCDEDRANRSMNGEGMHIMKTWLAGLVLMSMGVVGMAAEPAKVAGNPSAMSASGQAVFNGRTLPLRTALASWSTNMEHLEVKLYPFDLTPTEVERIRKAGKWDSVVSDKPSPDRKVWDWVPQVWISISFKSAVGPFTKENISSCLVSLVGFEKTSYGTECIMVRASPWAPREESELKSAFKSFALGQMAAGQPLALDFKVDRTDEPAYTLDVKAATEITRVSPF